MHMSEPLEKIAWNEVLPGDMKSLKLRKEDVLVCGKWRRLIRGTVEDSDDSGGYCVQLFQVPAHPDYPGSKGHKMVVVVVIVNSSGAGGGGDSSMVVILVVVAAVTIEPCLTFCKQYCY